MKTLGFIAIAFMALSLTSCEKASTEIFKGSLIGTNWTTQTEADNAAGKMPYFFDNGNADVKLQFHPDMTFDFIPSPVGYNPASFVNTYTYANGSLTVRSEYKDRNGMLVFYGDLAYNGATNTYSGITSTVWRDETITKNSFTLQP